MFRIRMAFTIIVLITLAVCGGTPAITAHAALPITLTGTLELAQRFGVPHYELGGYVLLHKKLDELGAMKGSIVTVTGQEVTVPTLFMAKALEVYRILPGTPPSDSGDQQVSTPVQPEPPLSAPGTGGPVSIPAPPVPFFGAPYYVLYGHLEAVDTSYYVTEQRADGPVRLLVTSHTVSLESMVGHTVGAVAVREEHPDGTVRYVIHEAVILSDDLGSIVSFGRSLLYVAPQGEVTVRLRGKRVSMDQPPIMGNGRTLVGLRAISEAMGAEVRWDDQTKTAAIRLDGREVAVRVGSNVVVVRKAGTSEQYIFNDVAPVVVHGRLLVPARVLSEGLGLHVTWSPKTQTVDLH